jgi:hypothetical protein
VSDGAPSGWISPRDVLREVAAAIPADCRPNVVVIGSLAAAYQLFGADGRTPMRTKDVDCMLSPRVSAVSKGAAWTERLFDAGWTFRANEEFRAPGDATTPLDRLPAVRMKPPSSDDWFVELLTVPEASADRERRFLRLETRHGHFGIPSFGFLSLVNVDPLETELGIRVARTEMMALANLLEHPVIADARMSTSIAGRSIKRSNKDLGRVLAILRETDDDATMRWPDAWWDALQRCFPKDAATLARRAGSGMAALLRRPGDLDEARHACNNGLLAASPVTVEQLEALGRRLVADAIEPLERRADDRGGGSAR